MITDVYPNPSTQYFTIKTARNLQVESWKVEIRNIQGQLIQEYSGGGQNQITIDLGNFPSGIYLYQARMDGELKDSRKLIKD